MLYQKIKSIIEHINNKGVLIMKLYIKSDLSPSHSLVSNGGTKKLLKYAPKALASFLESIFYVPRGDILVKSLEYIDNAKYGQCYNMLLVADAIFFSDDFVNEESTPELYQLLQLTSSRNRYGDIYSDIIVKLGGSKYEDYSGDSSVEVYDRCPYSVNYDELDKECKDVENHIIKVLKSHKQDILDLLDSYVLD